MKLRNKKTGEIGYFCFANWYDPVLNIMDENGIQLAKYNSLAELNKEWEDYEEPKGYYCILSDGTICYDNKQNIEYDRCCMEIGNHFETKEEAELAVRKLKAWKRLKDDGFRFSGFVYTELKDYARVNIKATMINDSINDDLNLLFRGEE